MGFLAPWFLAGVVAAGLPVYLHLLQRHTATPHSFSSLMFFEKRTQSSVKHRRLRYLLLFSLRLAMLILLVLAFANPFINRSDASVSADKLLVVILDDSFSMRTGTRLADARNQALSVLDSRKPAQSAQVVALDSQPRLLTQVTQDGPQLRAAVQSVQPGDSHANFAELSRLLRSMSDTLRIPIEAHLFSDMQRSGMPGSFAEMAIPAGVTLVPHAVATDAVPNWAVESVNAPGEVADPKKAQVQVVVAGYHTPAAMRTVSLEVNGKTVASQSVMVPAGGRATAQFMSLDVPYGLTRCQLKIDSADVLPADDAYLFAVVRSDPQKVLFVHEPSDSRSPLYFNSALGSAAETAFTLDSISVDRIANADPSKYAFVVLSDVLSLPGSFEDALHKYVTGGGNILIAAGTSTANRHRVPVTGDAITDAHYYSRDPARFLTVGDADPAYPSLDKSNKWAGVRFYFAARMNPDSSYRVAARLTDQTPLLLEKRIGEGRVIVLTSGFDNLTNDFPLHPVFVPFVEQTARYLSGIQRRSGSALVDSFMELRTAKEQAVSVEVVDPAGQRPLSLKEATTAQSYQLTRAGFYELHLASGRHDLIGVNPDRRESDLDVIPADVMALWRGNQSAGQQPASAGVAPEENTRAYGLWWYFILVMLAVGLAESVVASRYLGTRREES
jgi:hypothetical protein